ncbi:glycosyltransferase family 4 protein [Phycicoccus sp. Root563]|uniref:glycosyltransferase family 4 protein n=1 Tax=Phycicoccus sp. Root563 TaxID=1736562 RepID=UPI000A973B5A|nr:glycosyltransferase family 4 protein [Phycicoccus sp. Root563]
MTPAPSEIGRRVALVANPSADLYGSDRMVLEAVRGLRQDGWDVVVAATQDGPLKAEMLALGAQWQLCRAPVVRKSNLRPGGLVQLAAEVVRGLPSMVRTLRRVRPDVLYVNTVTIPLWLLVAKVLGVPSVVHVHEAESSVPRVARVGLALPTRLATRVICNSETSRAVTASSGGPTARMVVVRNGVAGPDHVEAPRLQPDGVRLVFVGRLSPRKGVDVAVLAAAALLRRGIDARLEVVGDVFPGYEWYHEELVELIRREALGDHVSLVGFASDVWPHLRAADVVLVPSRSEESFGNSVVEAALSARPVVVSDHTGLREAASTLRAAVRVAVDDPDAVAAAVEGLLSRWEQTREDALRDADVAAREYAPARYREAVCGVLVAAAATR